MDLTKLQTLPNGARFYKCALQVNTFDYVKRHKRPTSFDNEDSYNAALIEACKQESVEVIALADHYRIQPAAKLIDAARAAGLAVFPGFEAVSKEGVHFICLFDPSVPISKVQGHIHGCGVHNDADSPIGSLDASELLEQAHHWPAQLVAAHISNSGGLFRALQAGQARIAIWRNTELQACSIPGSTAEATEDLRPILENKNPDYKRDRPIAILNCQDICSPEDLRKSGATCYLKMTAPTLEGFRQAFLDPQSRVRLNSDPIPEEHTEFVAMTWETEGFLRNCQLRFNENLNVLIGGRGAGKSTIVESIRYVLGLEPIGDEARRIHEGIVHGVLGAGTKISLLVRSYKPDERLFTIERSSPNPPKVIDSVGNVLAVKPIDVVRGVTVFGQNELAEISRSPEKLTGLLQRFIPSDSSQDEKIRQMIGRLEKSRMSIVECEESIRRAEEALAALPGIEDTLSRYRAAGIEDKLRSQTLMLKAEGVLETARQTLATFSAEADAIDGLFPVRQDFLSDNALDGLPHQSELTGIRAVLTALEAGAKATAVNFRGHVDIASNALESIASKLSATKEAEQDEYSKALRDLQRSKIDGTEFLQLQQSLERLSPLRVQLEQTSQKRDDLLQQRRNDLATWEELKRERYQKLERAARRVSRELPNRLRVTVAYAKNREPLSAILRERVGQRLSETIDAINACEDLSVSAFAASCREGAAALVKTYGLPLPQAERIARAGTAVFMLIEELELSHATDIELNVGLDNAPADWRKLDKLSTGQKATALLYLLLLETEGPLVLDQPEDNLDNRFISEGVVPKIKQEKGRRQFIFSTHNANIPVLGDAELIVCMRAAGEPGDGYAEIPNDLIGAIDQPSVARLVEEILEGGEDAFETRRLKYGF
jgi:hypothetical protein